MIGKSLGGEPPPDARGLLSIGAWYAARVDSVINLANFTPFNLDENGFKKLTATGSITQGSNQLVLASNPGFQIGDTVIVAIGTEAGLGQPGTMGVGGAWPSLNYATTAALLADTTQPVNTFAWAQDTGQVYQWSIPGHTNNWFNIQSGTGNWYWWLAVPLALVAKVTNVSGSTLTLDTNASATATAAGVYFDNAPVINAIVPNAGTAMVLGSGRYAISTTIYPGGNPALINNPALNTPPNILFAGVGSGSTTIFSPPGAQSATVLFQYTKPAMVSGMTIEGNVGLNSGFGLIIYNQTRQPDLSTAMNILYSNYPIMDDIVVINSFISLNFTGCNYGVIRNCRVRSAGLQRYTQSHVMLANCSYCFSQDCSLTADWMIHGFEHFASNFCAHIRPTTTNAMMTFNSAGSCVFDSPSITLTSLCQLSELSFAHTEALFEVTSNINQNLGKRGYNSVFNASFTQQGYVNSLEETFAGFLISASTGLDIEGGSYTAPDWANKAFNLSLGPLGVRSDSSSFNTSVSNFTVVGSPHPDWGSINVVNGTVTACTAPQIVCAGPACVLS